MHGGRERERERVGFVRVALDFAWTMCGCILGQATSPETEPTSPEIKPTSKERSLKAFHTRSHYR